MRLSELLSRMWYPTKIILVRESSSYKLLHSVTQFKAICDWWGTVSDFVNVDCPNRPDKRVKGYGVVNGYMVIITE